MQKHFAVFTGVAMLVVAVVVVSQSSGVLQGTVSFDAAPPLSSSSSKMCGDLGDFPTCNGGGCERATVGGIPSVCTSFEGRCVCAPPLTSSVTSGYDYSSSSTTNDFCKLTCEAGGLCCKEALGNGGFPTCKSCDICNPVDDLSASFCCSPTGFGNNSAACCQYNPSYCPQPSSSSTKPPKPIVCKPVENQKRAFGTSAEHLYADGAGQNAQTVAYDAAAVDAIKEAEKACATLEVGPCAQNCSTVSVDGPSFTPDPSSPGNNNPKCNEVPKGNGVHAVGCTVLGTCTVTRKCSVKL